MSIIERVKSGKRSLSEDDIPKIKHDFRKVYGWISNKDWEDIPIDELFDDYVFVQEEIRKKEQFRVNVMSGLGAKQSHINKWMNG